VITDRDNLHSVEDPVRRLEEMRDALNQAAIVATTDHRGVITYANDKFCEISGYSRGELIGQDHRIVNSGHHPKEFIRELWRTIARGRVWRGELKNRAKDGSIYWVDTTIVPFLNEDGKPRQYLAIRSDITQRKAAEALLREQDSLAQLGQLAAVVAHEVRNPLAGLRGSLQILESRLPVEIREREIIGAMIQRIDGLSKIVQDILLFARPQPPTRRPVEILTVISDAVSSARATPEFRSELTVSAPDAVVLADPDMLRSALLNLLLNACQASNDSPVEIVAVPREDGCHIDVRDRGPGIPADVLEHVFDPFFTTKTSGTGLGLPIVKRLLTSLGGSISLRPREGGGTVAEIIVPLHTPERRLARRMNH
jgi:two-component system CheB/CheR fusion protein